LAVINSDSTQYASEYDLWDDICDSLVKTGYDLSVEIPSNDGHLFGDRYTRYLRPDNENTGAPHIFVYDGKYAIRFLYEEYNEGELSLDIMLDVFGVQTDCIDRIRELHKEDSK
jgi:hypothetical protein